MHDGPNIPFLQLKLSTDIDNSLAGFFDDIVAFLFTNSCSVIATKVSVKSNFDPVNAIISRSATTILSWLGWVLITATVSFTLNSMKGLISVTSTSVFNG
ncbi:hypothetical protein [Vibrio gallaecicus]|uniref:hypothetical protein n=1 Tax=Vibrio gallaecicus TaxID=552386 RepID=UPI0025B4AFB0|nr:hypothetical protein [Vibrio gallaecicus]MDN3617195.1 hypothetical protein [Vibrio gallaecicus]